MKKTVWTQFMDMHSGGDCKEPPYEYIFIEASEEEAKIIFYNRFGHNPERVTCTCCGDDYSISEEKSLEQATAYERNCEFDTKKDKYIEKQEKDKVEIREKCNTPKNDKWGIYQTLAQFKKRKDILIIPKNKIKAKEQIGEIPE